MCSEHVQNHLITRGAQCELRVIARDNGAFLYKNKLQRPFLGIVWIVYGNEQELFVILRGSTRTKLSSLRITYDTRPESDSNNEAPNLILL